MSKALAFGLDRKDKNVISLTGNILRLLLPLVQKVKIERITTYNIFNYETTCGCTPEIKLRMTNND